MVFWTTTAEAGSAAFAAWEWRQPIADAIRKRPAQAGFRVKVNHRDRAKAV